MNNMTLLESPVMEARGWRISFEASAPKDQSPLVIVREPRNLFAIAHEIDIADVLADSRSEDDDSLLLVWLPCPTSHSFDLERRLDMWLCAGQGSQQPLVRGGIRTIRVVWSERRALIYAAADELEVAMDAVIRFTLAAQQTLTLEQQMAAAWPTIEIHTPLTHSVSRGQLRMQPQVDEMTERATRMQVTHLRLQNAVEQLDRTLTTASKLLFSELVLQADLFHRLEMLENPIEFLLDHYELSTTRLLEVKFARIQLWLEVTIVVVITAELLTVLVALAK